MGVFVSLLLTTAAWMGTPAEPEDPAARAQATLRHVAHVSPAEQRAWLEGLVRRLALATSWALNPEDARREKDRVAALLREKTVAWPTLARLLKQLDEREKAAISRLVRQYRSQVYDAFHARPQQLVAREEAWYRVWAAWEGAGRAPEEQYRLLEWLAVATRNSTVGSMAALPPDPKFGPGDAIAMPAALPLTPAEPSSASPAQVPSPAPASRPLVESQPQDENPLAVNLQPAPLALRPPEAAVSSSEPRQSAIAIPSRRTSDVASPPLRRLRLLS